MKKPYPKPELTVVKPGPPKQEETPELIKSQQSTDAKLLYDLMLDRMSLSAKNGWCDHKGRVYIYYSMDEVMTDLNCGHNKALTIYATLEENFTTVVGSMFFLPRGTAIGGYYDTGLISKNLISDRPVPFII